VDSRHKDSFYESARRMLPFIEYEDLEPEMAGIRPKLQGPGEDVKDFVIKDESDKGLPGFINLIGIESPGLTSSPAIGRYVAAIVKPFCKATGDRFQLGSAERRSPFAGGHRGLM
jgi:L-2-hydroxyglutarate oxidase LhgO